MTTVHSMKSNIIPWLNKMLVTTTLQVRWRNMDQLAQIYISINTLLYITVCYMKMGQQYTTTLYYFTMLCVSSVCYKTSSPYVVHTDTELTMWPTMASNLHRSSCLSLSSDGVTGVCHLAWLTCFQHNIWKYKFEQKSCKYLFSTSTWSQRH